MQNWYSKEISRLSKAELSAIKKANNQALVTIKNEKKSYQEEKEKEVKNLWESLPEAAQDHPYLAKKQVCVHGIKLNALFNNQRGTWLIIPIRDIDGKLISLQGIDNNGRKQFYAGASSKGVFIFGDLDNTTNQAYLCEGWATGATIHEVTGKVVVCAFDCGKLKGAAEQYTAKYPNAEWVVAADNDAHGDKNIGLDKAKEISSDLGISYTYPVFQSDSMANGENVSDWNDYSCLYGIEQTKLDIASIQQEIAQSTQDKIKNIEIFSMDANGNQKRRSQADILEDIGRCCHFIIDGMGDIYAVIRENKVRKVYALQGSDYTDWLNSQYYALTNKGANANSLRDALATLQAYAKHRPKKAAIFLRFGYSQDKIYIDLCNNNWEVLEISKTGCHITQEAPVYFVRTPTMQEMAVDLDAQTQDFISLYRLVNAPEEQQSLLLCWLLAAIKGKSPYAVLNIYGSADSGKTTLTKAMRDLIDPTSAATRKFPKDERNLIATLKNNAVLAFDNTGVVMPELSDDLARLTFGKDAGISQRQLYTDDSEKVYNRQAPVIINSISDAIIRPDLQNRCLDITPETLSQLKNKELLSEDEWADQFKSLSPKIRGALFNMLAKGLGIVNEIPSGTKGRLRELIKLSTAVERATGIFSEGTTLQQYDKMRADSAINLITSIPLTQYIIRKMTDPKAGEQWDIPTSDFQYEYNSWRNTQGERSVNPRKIGRELSVHKKNMAEMGIQFKERRSNGNRYYTFTKTNGDLWKTHDTHGTESDNSLLNNHLNSANTASPHDTVTAPMTLNQSHECHQCQESAMTKKLNGTVESIDMTSFSKKSAISAINTDKTNNLFNGESK